MIASAAPVQNPNDPLKRCVESANSGPQCGHQPHVTIRIGLHKSDPRLPTHVSGTERRSSGLHVRAGPAEEAVATRDRYQRIGNTIVQ